MSYQNDLAHVKGLLQDGKITAAEANVKLVQLEGVRVITGSVPREVRAALNAAVKAGQLGHIKKDGLKPEVYHHINARPRALQIRAKENEAALKALARVMAPGPSPIASPNLI